MEPPPIPTYRQSKQPGIAKTLGIGTPPGPYPYLASNHGWPGPPTNWSASILSVTNIKRESTTLGVCLYPACTSMCMSTRKLCRRCRLVGQGLLFLTMLYFAGIHTYRQTDRQLELAVDFFNVPFQK